MQFNDETNGQGILQDMTFWTNADKGITDADNFVAYPLADRTRNSNFAMDKVVGLILQADQRWKWDDTNNTDLPIGRTNIVSGQRDYGISGATYLKVLKVQYLLADGTWRTLNPLDQHSPEGEIAHELSQTGDPTGYDLHGNSIWLDKAPTSNRTSGLRIFFQRNVSYFATTDTTKEPGFAQPFHRLVPLYASEDYVSVHVAGDRLNLIQRRIQQLEQALIDFYSSRNAEEKVNMRFRKEDYGQRILGRSAKGSRKYPHNVIY